MKHLFIIAALLFVNTIDAQDTLITPLFQNYHEMPTGDTLHSVGIHNPEGLNKVMKISVGCTDDGCNYNYMVRFKEGAPYSYSKFESDSIGRNTNMMFMVKDDSFYTGWYNITQEEALDEVGGVYEWALLFNSYIDKLVSGEIKETRAQLKTD